jgi:hypothetical protein
MRMLSELLSDVSYRLRALFSRGSVERELDEELRFHLEREAEKYERQGMSSESAMRRARLAHSRIIAAPTVVRVLFNSRFSMQMGRAGAPFFCHDVCGATRC